MQPALELAQFHVLVRQQLQQVLLVLAQPVQLLVLLRAVGQQPVQPLLQLPDGAVGVVFGRRLRDRGVGGARGELRAQQRVVVLQLGVGLLEFGDLRLKAIEYEADFLKQ